MTEAFTAYIKTITALIVFSATASLFLPNGTFRQYTKWVLGVLVLTAMIEPIWRLFDTENAEIKMHQIIATQPKYDTQLQQKWVKKTVEQTILTELQKEYPQIVSVNMQQQGDNIHNMEIIIEEKMAGMENSIAKKYGLKEEDILIKTP